MRRQGGLLIAFGYAVLLFEALRMGLAWWNGELTEFGLEQGMLVAAVPLLAWVAWQVRRPLRRRPPAP
jgi:hypothetical protein